MKNMVTIKSWLLCYSMGGRTSYVGVYYSCVQPYELRYELRYEILVEVIR
eukprot:COSAG05_NODE_15266_length_374_cov_0.447273_1_plen_50_part_01